MKENIKKITRLSYVVLLCVISYAMLIGSGNSLYSPIGSSVSKALQKSLTNHFFLACYKKEYRKNYYIKECFNRKETLQIKGQIVNVNNYHQYPLDWKAFKEFNNDNNIKYTWEYSNDRKLAYYKSNKLTPKIMWPLFIITLPLIWFSRNFSISIVNSTMSVFKKGWKKL